MRICLLGIGLAAVMTAEVWAHEHLHHGEMAAGDPQESAPQAQAGVNEQMSHHHLDMGPHMKMTATRPTTQADKDRAALIVATTREALGKYKDYKVALADGYKIFLPNVPTKMKHFTNNSYAMENAFGFNPAHPTSLLYQVEGDKYKLIGAMYTAPKRLTEDDLDKRVPLSVAKWHAHVNFCWPPRAKRQEMFKKDSQFGMMGSISTPEACDAAGGRFIPQVFGWMLHVYPYEATLEKQFSMEPQRMQ
jgi:methionine-rich copper-binding protein CopC